MDLRTGLAARSLNSQIRAIYRGLFAVTLTVMGGRSMRSKATAVVREGIDEAMSPGGTPKSRIDLATVGAQGPVAIGLAIAIPGLLAYPLYESLPVLRALVGVVLICVAFSATQFFHLVVALLDRRQWAKKGSPSDWKSPPLAHPSGFDLIAWWLLSLALLVAVF